MSGKVKMLENLSKAIFYLEDFSTFKEVQMNKYISEKQSTVKKDSPEWDMVTDLIKDYWCELLATGYINNKDSEEKEIIFGSINIIFPYDSIPNTWTDGITYVDFISFSS